MKTRRQNTASGFFVPKFGGNRLYLLEVLRFIHHI